MIEKLRRVEKWFSLLVMVAAVLAIPAIVFQDIASDPSEKDLANLLDWSIWTVFAVQLILILITERGREGIFKRTSLLVLIVALTFPILPASMNSLKLLRVLQLFALLRLNQKTAARIFSTAGIKFAALTVVIIALGGGAALKVTEGYHSTWEGVWLSVQTMTTATYGDVVPETVGGRLIAVFIMFVGIGFVTLIMGAIARKFIASHATIEQPLDRLHGDQYVVSKLDEICERMDRLEKAVGSKPPI